MTKDTNTASGAADLPEALRLAAAISNLLCSNEEAARTLAAAADELVRLHAESEMRRAALLDEMQKAALAAGQATAAQAGAPANMQVTEKMRAAGDCAWMTADRVDSARVFRAMLAAAPAQPAAQQPHRSGCTAGTDEACVQRGCGINCPAVSPRQVVAYAALPAPNYPKSGGFPGTFAEAQMHAFADATHALRASHGQAPAQPDPAYSAACHLATALFKKYFAHLPDFASGQAVWGLCGSTAGVISQIDNMVSGLVQPPTTAFSEDEL